MSTALKQLPLERQPTSHLSKCVSNSLQITETIDLTFGDKIGTTSISYSLYGDLTKPVIVILGGISANQFVADTDIQGTSVNGWWDKLVGYGKAIDLEEYCVVSIDYLDGQSSQWLNPKDDLLKISTFDQATILDRVLKHLKIPKLACLIGASYGGMVGLAFAQKFPSKLDQLIAIGCTEQSSAKNTAFRSLQRQILAFAIQNNQEKQGLALARSLAMLGYRGEAELESRFKNQICDKQQSINFPINDYLKSQGDKFANYFNAQRFLNLSLSVDLHKIDPQKISTDCLCVGLQNDLIAPVEQVKKLTSNIGLNAKFAEIKTNAGHDGFLKEFDQLAQLFKSRLEY